MKTKFIFLLFVILLLSTHLQAQTKIIAHKSHSGKAATFNIHSSHNFGWVPIMVLDTLVRLSDSVYVEIMHERTFNNIEKDTVVHNANTKNYYRQFVYIGKSLEELKADYPQTVFIGFEEAQQKPKKKFQFLHQELIPIDKQDQNNSNDLIFWLFGGIFLFGFSLSYSIWSSHQPTKTLQF